jgi:hypothetical protein
MVRIATVAEILDSKYLTDDEIVRRINAIDAATAVRLERMATIYAYGTGWSHADLLQEAFIAALERRQWRADLDTVVFLSGAMRSLAHAKRKHAKVSALDRAVAGGEDHHEKLQEIPAEDETDPAEILQTEELLSQLVERLTECFEGDSQVQRVICGRAAGETPAAIRADLRLSQSQYETVCRRMLRGYQTRMKVKSL